MTYLKKGAQQLIDQAQLLGARGRKFEPLTAVSADDR